MSQSINKSRRESSSEILLYAGTKRKRRSRIVCQNLQNDRKHVFEKGIILPPILFASYTYMSARSTHDTTDKEETRMENNEIIKEISPKELDKINGGLVV